MPSERGTDFPDVRIRAAGKSWNLPGRSALVWINMCHGEDNTFPDVFPGMISHKDAWEMWEAWKTFDDMERRSVNAARVALGKASGREWWWTHNLINEVVDSWTSINGILVREGVRAEKERLPNWLDAAYILVCERSSEEERIAFRARLNLPPKNVGMLLSNTATRKALLDFANF